MPGVFVPLVKSTNVFSIYCGSQVVKVSRPVEFHPDVRVTSTEVVLTLFLLSHLRKGSMASAVKVEES